MAKRTKDVSIREFCKIILSIFLNTPEKMRHAAKTTELSFNTVEQANIYGKGSAITFGLLFSYGLGIAPKDLSSYANKFKKAIEERGELDYLDGLFAEARHRYSNDELINFLKVLLAKDEIESSLGLKKKTGRPKKQIKC
jgi:hypothetical protein